MSDPIVVQPKSPNVVVVEPSRGFRGPSGPTGPTGPPGPGFPTGGAAGDLLEKTGSGVSDNRWVNRPRLLVLDPAAPIPVDTLIGTVVFRRVPE